MLEDEEDLAKEQEVYDDHEEDVAQLFLRHEKLVSSGFSLEYGELMIAFKQLKHLGKSLTSISNTISSFTAESDIF